MPSPSGWRRMLTLFTLASFIEVIAYGQLAAFTPLHLPTIGVAPDDVPIAVGLITVGANVIGLLFLPFWRVLADRYGRKPLIIRSFVAPGSGLALAAAARAVPGAPHPVRGLAAHVRLRADRHPADPRRRRRGDGRRHRARRQRARHARRVAGDRRARRSVRALAHPLRRGRDRR